MFNVNDVMEILVNQDHLPTKIVKILKEKHFRNETEFYRFYEELLMKYTSSYLLQSQWIEFYPIIKERTAKTDFSCYLSGTKIKKGDFYITYHPFIEDLETKKVYVTKREIKSIPDFLEYFPTDILSYEDWYSRLQNSYSYEIMNVGGVDFYNLSIEGGEHCLDLYPLNLSKTKKKRN